MSLAAFGHPPPGIPGCPVPFNLHIPSSEIHTLTTLVQHARIASPSFYNLHADPTNGTFGVSRDWLATAQQTWTDPSSFDWRSQEEYHNKFPNFVRSTHLPNQTIYLPVLSLFLSSRPRSRDTATPPQLA